MTITKVWLCKKKQSNEQKGIFKIWDTTKGMRGEKYVQNWLTGLFQHIANQTNKQTNRKKALFSVPYWQHCHSWVIDWKTQSVTVTDSPLRHGCSEYCWGANIAVFIGRTFTSYGMFQRCKSQWFILGTIITYENNVIVYHHTCIRLVIIMSYWVIIKVPHKVLMSWLG